MNLCERYVVINCTTRKTHRQVDQLNSSHIYFLICFGSKGDKLNDSYFHMFLELFLIACSSKSKMLYELIFYIYDKYMIIIIIYVYNYYIQDSLFIDSTTPLLP